MGEFLQNYEEPDESYKQHLGSQHKRHRKRTKKRRQTKKSTTKLSVDERTAAAGNVESTFLENSNSLSEEDDAGFPPRLTTPVRQDPIPSEDDGSTSSDSDSSEVPMRLGKRRREVEVVDATSSLTAEAEAREEYRSQRAARKGRKGAKMTAGTSPIPEHLINAEFETEFHDLTRIVSMLGGENL